MHRILLIALLAAAVACSGKSSPTTPKNQPPAVVDAPLSKATLVAFVQQRFPEAVVAGTFKLDFGSAGMEDELVTELGIMGITSTGQLAAIVPPDYQTKGVAAVAASESPTTNISGLIRDLLIIHDLRGYFTKAWRNSWSSSGPTDFPAPAAYGADFAAMEELGVFSEGDYEGGDEGYNPCMGDGDGEDGGDPCGD